MQCSIATGSGHPDHQGQSGYVLPGQSGYVLPGQSGYVLPGQQGLTRYIKYPGLTQILLRINNDVPQWQYLGQCEHIMSLHFEKSHC